MCGEDLDFEMYTYNTILYLEQAHVTCLYSAQFLSVTVEQISLAGHSCVYYRIIGIGFLPQTSLILPWKDPTVQCTVLAG